MFADQLLVTFRSQAGPSARPPCALRIQIPEGEDVVLVENFLAGAVQGPVELRSVAVPDGVCFEIVGSYRSILDLLAVDEALEDVGQPASSGTVKQRLRTAALAALRSWHRLDYHLELPGRREWRLGDGPAIMGILNVTPDSFSDGGRHLDPEHAIEHGVRLVEEGADVIDVGGESTRPGSSPVSADEEIRRVRPVVAGLRKRIDCPISIDTSKAEVARVALDEGADIVNDVTALAGDPEMAALVRERGVPAVLMHMRGRPATMQDDPRYVDPVAEILRYLARRLVELRELGIDPQRTIIDPGIGFGKRSGDNLELIRGINEFRSLGRPVLIGVSRKSFLGKLLGRSVEEREAGTLVANTYCALAGVAILRTHDVRNAREMKKLLAALRNR